MKQNDASQKLCPNCQESVESLNQKGDNIEGMGSEAKTTFQVSGKVAQNGYGQVSIQLHKQSP